MDITGPGKKLRLDARAGSPPLGWRNDTPPKHEWVIAKVTVNMGLSVEQVPCIQDNKGDWFIAGVAADGGPAIYAVGRTQPFQEWHSI